MRIGIYHTGGPEWTGGERYVRNLLLALRHVPFAEPVFIAPGNKTEAELAEWARLGCEVLRTHSLTRWTPSWWLRQLSRLTKRMDYDVWSESFLKDHRIAVTYLRPCTGIAGAVPNVAWVPDFQHLHLPDMFSQDDVEFRSRQILLAAQYSTQIVLSSHHAYQDFSALAPAYASKGRVLQFVASVDPGLYCGDPAQLSEQVGAPKKFFYLPNQFWRHKNHLVVVRALGLLKQMGQHVVVVCTGNMKDYRHPAYLAELQQAVRDLNVEDRFLTLGMVPADAVFALLRQSVAVINPSLFEGWSTTVEESKSIGKKILLSDIPVHIEQAPPGGIYFGRNDAEDLAQKMLEFWRLTPPGPDVNMESQARERLPGRLEACGRRFFEIAVEASCGFSASAA